MFPEGFIKRLDTQGYLNPGSLIKSLGEPSPVSIRINPAKCKRLPENSEKVEWCDSGYYLENRPSFTLDPLFHSGCYYPQEASGMFIEQIFRQIVPGSGYLKVLDLCGAPGGKSTHISSLIGPESLLVSNEVIRTRALVLSENITKWGIPNTVVTQNDPAVFGKLPGFFDVILVDAPCSGEGMFRDPVAVSEWSETAAFHCSERQKRILADVWPALKQGGILIYSTCTFNPGENEDNIKWLIETSRARSLELDTGSFKEITPITYQGIYGYGFYPDRIKGEGLFISVVKKEEAHYKSYFSTFKKPGNEIRNNDLSMVSEWTHFRPEKILRSGNEIFHIPGRMDDYINLKSYLRIINPGTRICSVKKSGYIPSPDLALSAGIRKEAFHIWEADYDKAIAFLRRDQINPGIIPKGYFLISFNGVIMGFGNNIGQRSNNYYPVEWRIRMSVPESGPGYIIEWHE